MEYIIYDSNSNRWKTNKEDFNEISSWIENETQSFVLYFEDNEYKISEIRGLEMYYERMNRFNHSDNEGYSLVFNVYEILGDYSKMEYDGLNDK